jgi:hypothetical protein
VPDYTIRVRETNISLYHVEAESFSDAFRKYEAGEGSWGKEFIEGHEPLTIEDEDEEVRDFDGIAAATEKKE